MDGRLLSDGRRFGADGRVQDEIFQSRDLQSSRIPLPMKPEELQKAVRNGILEAVTILVSIVIGIFFIGSVLGMLSPFIS
jgi:hypothetical protein